MSLIDTHAHLTFPELSTQLDDVLARCAQAGVEQVITIGTQLDDARQVLALCARLSTSRGIAETSADAGLSTQTGDAETSSRPCRVSAALGFHPHEADNVSEEDLAEMARLWQQPSVVAVGEMGLDYHYDFADRVRQRDAFSRQLAAAFDVDKPLVIHCREALDDAIPLLIDHGYARRRVVFHCFTGTADEAERIAHHGWRISFTGVVTFRKSKELQEIARAYPANQIMVETDAPYLSPVPVRGKHPNEPAHVAHTARFLAELRGVSFEELSDQIMRNATEFFKLQDI